MITFKQISSLDNETVKTVAALHHRKYRDEQKRFIAEGIRIIATLLEAGIIIEQLYITDQAHFEPFKKSINSQQVTLVTTTVMKKMSAATTPSGLLAVFQIPQMNNLKKLSAGIVLAEIADPGNMGTLIRTTAAMGKKSAVIVGGSDPWSPKVIQASAGTIGRLNIFIMSWHELVQTARENTMSLIALVVHGGKSPNQLSFTDSLIVVGNEAHGLPEEWIADCTTTMTLPMPGNIESLNAAVAGSIALYFAYMQEQQH